MKKFPVVFFALASIIFIACRHFGNGNLSISNSESGRYYSMKAHFDQKKTREVEEYMNDRIGSGYMSFVNTRIDGLLALEDHTKIYVKKYPGFIEIKIDKSQNSNEACQRIKSMCEGIKNILAK
ncbi:MAG TPA: hypothetical protein VK588_12900 [Chitinophagaceae bacterium]|nr:hypothetical protein [Chitinophagaceae bacterium]